MTNVAKIAPWCALILAGCAVPHSEVSQLAQEKTALTQSGADQAKVQLRQESRLSRMHTNFIGDEPIDLPYAASLPPVFFENIFIRARSEDFGSVAQSAKNIAIATGLPVRVNADVLEKGVESTGTRPETSPQNPGGNLSYGATPSGFFAPATAESSAAKLIRLNYKGVLLHYVKEVANTAGIEWEYKDGGINFFRLITKTFVLSSNPGEFDIADTMAKGGQASTGQQAGASSSSSGSINNSSSVGTKGSYSLWKAIKPALESTLSTDGKLAINESTGTVTVTDTKDVVAKVAKIIEKENAILQRQVSVEVRIIRIDVTKQTQLGLNLNSVYAFFKDGASAGSFSTTSQASQVSSSVGTLTFSVTDASSRFNGASVGLQALNQFGDVLSDSTSTVLTTNRVPVMTGDFATRGFLASTTPAAGGATAGGAGVPGLTPGSVTTGSFMRVLPTIKENNTVLLNLSVDVSDLLGFGSATTGSGSTLQQIQWANTSGTKTLSNLQLNQGESMVLAGIGTDVVNANRNAGVAGASSTATKTKTMFLVIVTPRILKGM
jgi:type IVB pilus formation R64 PilN family outer membrane protein